MNQQTKTAERSVAAAPSGVGEPFAHLYEFLEGTGDCAYLLNEDWRFTYLNKLAQQEIAGGRDLLGCNIWDVFPDVECRLGAAYRNAWEARQTITLEDFIPSLASWYEIKAVPLSSGGLGVWFRNINERKATARALAEVDERYRLAARATNDLVWDWDLVADEIRWNEALSARLGYELQELGTSGEWWSSRVHPDDLEAVKSSLDDCLKGTSDAFNCEYRFRRADNSYADIFDRGFVLRDEKGRAYRMVGAMQDNSERNASIQALQENERRLSTIFGQAMIGIMLVDRDGTPSMINRRFCEILGRSEPDIRRIGLRELGRRIERDQL